MTGPIRLAVYVQPRAGRTEVAGRHGEVPKIRLAAPPVDDAANDELIRFVAELVGVPRRNVSLVAGAKSRNKIIEVQGTTAEILKHLSLLP